MQLETTKILPEIVPEQQFVNDGGIFDLLKEVSSAITNTIDNWDVVLSILSLVILVLGSTVFFLCSITKILKFQSNMENKARDEIRKKKVFKHRNLVKLHDLEPYEIDDELGEQIKSEELYDSSKLAEPPKESINVDDEIFNQWPEPPPPCPQNIEVAEIEIDYSTIDVPDTFDMWPEPSPP